MAALQRHGHEATEITLPFKWYPGEILADHILAAKLTDLSEFEGVPIDRMIGLKFPAYLARHPQMQFCGQACLAFGMVCKDGGMKLARHVLASRNAG